MALDTAEARGRVTIRPWRVGFVIDTSSPTQVRAAIANLSSVWGGVSMPIFDRNTPVAELEDAGRLFDVDALYADDADGPPAELLTKPGWAWRGRAQWGPFGSDEDGTFRTGLLRICALLGTSASFVLPTWEADDPSDLALAATWGLGDRLRMSYGTVPLEALVTGGVPDGTEVGALGATLTHVNGGRTTGVDGLGGLCILRPDHPEDVAHFWNLRAYGRPVIGIPAEAKASLLRFLLSRPLPSAEWSAADSGAPEKTLHVLGFEYASEGVIDIIREVADRAGLSIRPEGPPPLPQFLFGGLDTTITRSVRADFRPDAHWIDIDLPSIPLVEDSQASPFARGIVAAQVELRSVQGQDPRFTTQIPPYRRHSALVEHLPFVESVDHIRASHEGLVLGLDASVQDVRVPFAYNLDVMRLLFDDESVTVDQSDVGKFQTRAAEKFGGPFSGIFCQPGVRAAITLAAGKAAGVTLAHLREIIEKHRGGWPDSVMESRVTPREYATRAVNDLFHSGLFVPTLKVHCSHCRVESFVSADQLGSTMKCEFCGAQYNLALSHGLSQPEWRYRLAAHLRADQVEALLPALAATSLLQQLHHTGEPAALALGFRVVIDGRTIETDIAAYLPEPEWLAVLGEVKNGNRIDAKDIKNLELLRAKLQAKDIRCLLLFATLKDQFTVEEVAALRGLVERSGWITTSRGERVLGVPMVLTGPDVSHHFWDEDHPWRWEKENHAGIFDTAMVSCQRNLGLRSYTLNRDSTAPEFAFEWDDSVLVSTPQRPTRAGRAPRATRQ